MQPSELIESLLTALWGLVTFDIFVSPHLLVLFYYLGVLGGPLLGVMILRQLLAQHRRTEGPQFKPSEGLPNAWAQSLNDIKMLGLLAIVVFELLWRVMFELVMANFQMRDYLSIDPTMNNLRQKKPAGVARERNGFSLLSEPRPWGWTTYLYRVSSGAPVPAVRFKTDTQE